jgi:hypothetical protein
MLTGRPVKFWATEVPGKVAVGDIVAVRTASGNTWVNNVALVLQEFNAATGVTLVVVPRPRKGE